jgi:hypothetical protein
MADTVLSMARSMVGGALSKAASAAAAEMSLLMGVRKDIWYVCIDLIPIMNSKSLLLAIFMLKTEKNVVLNSGHAGSSKTS